MCALKTFGLQCTLGRERCIKTVLLTILETCKESYWKIEKRISEEVTLKLCFENEENSK